MFVLGVFIFGSNFVEQGVESSNLSVPTNKTPVQRLFYKLEESRYWGFIRSGAPEKRNKPYRGGSYSV